MSSIVERVNEYSDDPEEDWRDSLIRRYEEAGFYRHLIVPKPPEQPHIRVVRPRSTYDYVTENLPWDSAEAEEEAANFSFFKADLNRRYGHKNVFTAFPTRAMILENPEYGERPHDVFMVRPPEDIPQEDPVVPVEVDERGILKSMAAWFRQQEL